MDKRVPKMNIFADGPPNLEGLKYFDPLFFATINHWASPTFLPHFSNIKKTSLVIRLVEYQKCMFSSQQIMLKTWGGYPQENWVGVCGPLPKTITLFMTEICDLPYPIYDLMKKLILSL